MMPGTNEVQQTIVVVKQGGSSFGIASFIMGIISVFFLAPLFVPLALLFAVIAILKKDYLWSAFGVIFAVIGFATSPILLGLLGLVSIGATMPH